MKANVLLICLDTELSFSTGAEISCYLKELILYHVYIVSVQKDSQCLLVFSKNLLGLNKPCPSPVSMNDSITRQFVVIESFIVRLLSLEGP